MKNISKILQHPAISLDTPDTLTLFCKATADGIRLQILRLLKNDSLSVLEMARILDIRQSALSHHLKILATAGLVSTRRECNLIFYRRGLLHGEDSLLEIKTALFNLVNNLHLEESQLKQLMATKLVREQQSLDFFNKFADKFRPDEDLVADSQQYASCLTDLLGGLTLDDKTTVLEVGPGEGKLLPLLTKDFSTIIALDSAADMLIRARETADAKNIRNIEFVLGDTQAAVKKGIRANLIVISMVLHHVESPGDVFQHLHAILEPGGVVLIVDLCRHNQEWLRETRGDLWLGFEPEELGKWAGKAGFDNGQNLYLSLRNGFQIQMRLFHKSANHID